MKVLELYSGIGGMHLALKESGIKGSVVASIEINNIANEIYKFNFPATSLQNANIEGLTLEYLKQLEVDTILMSPPCQPFTRNGLQNDINDPRTASFLHILNLLPYLNIKQLLIENVKGFENSEMRNILIDTLSKTGYKYQEFIISPHQIGIPNSRHRYYCLAKKTPGFSFQTGSLMEHFPVDYEEKVCFSIESILEQTVDRKYYLSDKILLKYANLLDICYKHSQRSCCFTKAYGRFIEGTGSVFTEKTEKEVLEVFNIINTSELVYDSKLSLLKTLHLRFFTPREICRLMCFPDSFIFPQAIGDRKKYMVLGNSVNIKVISELIKILNSYLVSRLFLYKLSSIQQSNLSRLAKISVLLLYVYQAPPKYKDDNTNFILQCHPLQVKKISRQHFMILLNSFTHEKKSVFNISKIRSLQVFRRCSNCTSY